MSFYTSVNRYGNSILYRGYNDNGVAINERIKFKPKLYAPVDVESELKSFFGQNVKEIQFDSMGDAKEYVGMYEVLTTIRFMVPQTIFTNLSQIVFPKIFLLISNTLTLLTLISRLHLMMAFPHHKKLHIQ
jgi:hypothetical protein